MTVTLAARRGQAAAMLAWRPVLDYSGGRVAMYVDAR